ncbi:hypothetical protein EAG11_19125 [Flavobacterium sp. 140616W15]|nr:hypothetical protein EAG11_19125 [Flavobacterium sp. 140616W15]
MRTLIQHKQNLNFFADLCGKKPKPRIFANLNSVQTKSYFLADLGGKSPKLKNFSIKKPRTYKFS